MITGGASKYSDILVSLDWEGTTWMGFDPGAPDTELPLCLFHSFVSLVLSAKFMLLQKEPEAWRAEGNHR